MDLLNSYGPVTKPALISSISGNRCAAEMAASRGAHTQIMRFPDRNGEPKKFGIWKWPLFVLLILLAHLLFRVV